MKVGLVGVGKWGRTLVGVFEKCGCEIIAHNRKSLEPAQNLGEWMPLEPLIGLSDIVVAAAPPHITSDVMRLCQYAETPCFLTKPLMIDVIPRLTATTYVDYVHLWSPLYERLKKAVREYPVDYMSVWFYGDGPCRSFPGVLDYGPHALAMVYDLLAIDGFDGFARLNFSCLLDVVKAASEGVSHDD